METWKFADAPETLALTSREVLGGGIITRVEHGENGGWHCLDRRVAFRTRDLIFAPLSKLVETDESILDVADLPKGWAAIREDPREAWKREPVDLNDPWRSEKRREQSASLLEQMRRESRPLPPGTPTTTELIRVGRE